MLSRSRDRLACETGCRLDGAGVGARVPVVSKSTPNRPARCWDPHNLHRCWGPHSLHRSRGPHKLQSKDCWRILKLATQLLLVPRSGKATSAPKYNFMIYSLIIYAQGPFLLIHQSVTAGIFLIIKDLWYTGLTALCDGIGSSSEVV
jgi:hypothetical protein